MRQGVRGAENEDFEKIATSFHIWFKNKEAIIGLCNPSDFETFLERKMEFYVSLYLKIRDAHYNLTKGLENLFYYDYYPIARSLSYPLLMAPIQENDNVQTIRAKLRITSIFIERFTTIRMVNFKSISQSTVKYTFNSLTKEVRNKSLEELNKILKINCRSKK